MLEMKKNVLMFRAIRSARQICGPSLEAQPGDVCSEGLFTVVFGYEIVNNLHMCMITTLVDPAAK